MLPVIIVVAFLTLWIFFKIRNRQKDKYLAKMPGDIGFPIIGNFWLFIKATKLEELYVVFRDMGRRYLKQGIFKFHGFYFFAVGITDPKYLQVIANSPNAVNKGPFYSILYGSHPHGGVFITNDTATWKELRKPLSKLLKKKQIESEYHNTFIRRSKHLVEFIKKKWQGKEIDVKLDLFNFSIDSLSENLLGVKTNELEEQKFNYLHHITEFMGVSFMTGTKFFAHKMIGLLTQRIKSHKLNNIKSGAKRFIEWVFEERKRKVELNFSGDTVYYSDFLLERQKEKNLSLRTISWELGDVIVAGSDTGGIILCSALLFLAMFPEIQEEAYQEQIAILGANPMEEPTVEHLMQMESLTRVVKETIRWCGPVIYMKQTSGDIHLDKYTIPKGAVVLVMVVTICHDERFWEKPYSFYPNHFLPEKEAARPTYAYPVFGVGPRKCPGVQYGMNSLRVTLSYILRNFRLSTSLKFEEIKIVPKMLREFSSYRIHFEERC